MCTIHSKVVEDHQRELHPGAVLVLRQVSIATSVVYKIISFLNNIKTGNALPLQSCTMHQLADIGNLLEPEILPKRKFSLISPPACIGEIFYSTNYLPQCCLLHRRYDDLYCVGENLFHRILIFCNARVHVMYM